MRRTREVIRGLADDSEPHYGVSTGFGALATRHIPVEMRHQLQRSLVRSHAAGSGPEVEREVVRALMLLRISTLATGRTGIREETLTTYVAMLNAGITPVVHEYGSLGCSGDLAPLSHCALALMGEGVVRDAARRADAGGRRAGRGRHPARRAGGEGGPGPHQRHRRHARDAVPRHPRPARAARGRRHRRGDERRGAARHRRRVRRRPARAAAPARSGRVGREHPKGHGAQRDPRESTAPRRAPACRTPTRCAARRRSPAGPATPSTTPPAWPGGSSPPPSTTPWSPPTAGSRATATSTGRRSPTCSTSSRSSPPTSPRSRSAAPTGSSTSPRSHGLPPFLADDPGVDSGHMIAQYTQAAIVSEMKRLAAPASVDSIPSSAMQEDHVSMGWSAARKLRRAVDGLSRVLAVEVLTAARGIELRAPAHARRPPRRPSSHALPAAGCRAPGPRPLALAPRSRPPTGSSPTARSAAPPSPRPAP